MRKNKVESTAKTITLQSEAESKQLLETLDAENKELNSLYQELATTDEISSYTDDINAKIDSYKRTAENTLEAYKHSYSMFDSLSARWRDISRSRKKKGWLPSVPANSIIDVEEEMTNHFTSGLNIYKLLWVCFIGSFGGVIIETLWGLLCDGTLQSRAGLVYGPFNLLYGFAAVALTIALYKYRNSGRLWSFIGGFVGGSIIEYICSWWQEMMFGTVSWDYTNMPFNVNGRICLFYSLCWGVLGIFWVKVLYPYLAWFMLKIPNKIGKILTWVLTVFFIFNAVVTLITVNRWMERRSGQPASNSFYEFIDERFPDERMHAVFENIHFKD